MKKTGFIALLVTLVVIITGCGSTFETKQSAVLVKENGTILEASIEIFSGAYLDEAELESFVKESIADFVKENGKKSVEFTSLSVENGVATLFLKYDSCEHFAAFRGEEFFSKTMAEAMAEGYTLSGEYFQVKDGKLGSAVSSADMDDDLNVVITRIPIEINVSGKVRYISENLQLVDEDTVTPVDNYSEEYFVVIYK